MEPEPLPRRLAAIVSVDLVGYSALAERDEAAAAVSVATLRAELERAAAAHAGRLFSSAGDGFMLEFPSADSALEAALAVLAATSRQTPLRIGIHLGDVTVTASGDLLGHAVNIAARLREEAAKNCILASEAIHDLARGPNRTRLAPSGRIHIDKTSDSIDAFAFDPSGGMPIARGRRFRPRALAAASVSVIAIAAFAVAVWTATTMGGNRQSMMREIAAGVTQQMTSSMDGQEMIDGTFATLAALDQSSAPQERRALRLIRRGEISAAVGALEAFAVDLARQGASDSASAALARAGAIAQAEDKERALANFRQAAQMAPNSLDRYADLLRAVAGAEGYAQALSLARDTIEDRESRSDITAFAHLYTSLLAGDLSDVRQQRRAIDAAAPIIAAGGDPYLAALEKIARGYLALSELDLDAARALYLEGRAAMSLLPGHERDHQQGWLTVLSARGDFETAWNDGRGFIAERQAAGAPPSAQMMITTCIAGLEVARVAMVKPLCVEGAAGLSGTVGEPSGEVALAMLATEEGDFVAAQAHLEAARRSRWFSQLPANVFYIGWSEARLAAARGDLAAMSASIDRTLRQVRGSSAMVARAPMFVALLERVRADGALAAGAVGDACSALGRSVVAYRRVGGEEGARSAERLRHGLACTT